MVCVMFCGDILKCVVMLMWLVCVVWMCDGVDVDVFDVLEVFCDVFDVLLRCFDDDDLFCVELLFCVLMMLCGCGFYCVLVMMIDDVFVNVCWIVVLVCLFLGVMFDVDEIWVVMRASDGWTCETSGDADGE